MPQLSRNDQGTRRAFTLVELLVVMSIITLLMSILLPSLTRAREQAKAVHCVARLKEFGTAIAAYEAISDGMLPPASWCPSEQDLDPDTDDSGLGGKPQRNDPRLVDRCSVQYGWAETLFSYIYGEKVRVRDDFPVQRNIEGERWEKYFICGAAGDTGPNSGHYRIYLPAWNAGSYTIKSNGRYGDDTHADPRRNGRRERIPPKLPLIGDSNDRSERGDGLGTDDCSYIDAGEADYAGSNGINGNRFSDRHYGGTNFLFQDLHASWELRMRRDLARDYDLNGVIDVDVVP
jgi:prepilin-type N-terminal cleavage/methylation domain-containing protein/prepilin-type processing-associated H-X9-DG protein